MLLHEVRFQKVFLKLFFYFVITLVIMVASAKSLLSQVAPDFAMTDAELKVVLDSEEWTSDIGDFRRKVFEFLIEEQNDVGLNILIKNGMDPDIVVDSNLPAAMYAAKIGASKSLQILFENGADFSSETSEGLTVLNLAVQSGNIATVRVVLETGLSPDLVSVGWPVRPVLLAVSGGEAGIAQILLEYGANPLRQFGEKYGVYELAEVLGLELAVVFTDKKGKIIWDFLFGEHEIAGETPVGIVRAVGSVEEMSSTIASGLSVLDVANWLNPDTWHAKNDFHQAAAQRAFSLIKEWSENLSDNEADRFRYLLVHDEKFREYLHMVTNMYLEHRNQDEGLLSGIVGIRSADDAFGLVTRLIDAGECALASKTVRWLFDYADAYKKLEIMGGNRASDGFNWFWSFALTCSDRESAKLFKWVKYHNAPMIYGADANRDTNSVFMYEDNHIADALLALGSIETLRYVPPRVPSFHVSNLRSSDTLKWQKFLSDQGYYTMDIDGNWGVGTSAAEIIYCEYLAAHILNAIGDSTEEFVEKNGFYWFPSDDGSEVYLRSFNYYGYLEINSVGVNVGVELWKENLASMRFGEISSCRMEVAPGSQVVVSNYHWNRSVRFITSSPEDYVTITIED